MGFFKKIKEWYSGKKEYLVLSDEFEQKKESLKKGQLIFIEEVLPKHSEFGFFMGKFDSIKNDTVYNAIKFQKGMTGQDVSFFYRFYKISRVYINPDKGYKLYKNEEEFKTRLEKVLTEEFPKSFNGFDSSAEKYLKVVLDTFNDREKYSSLPNG